MTIPRLTRDQLRSVKKMSINELDGFLQRFYIGAFTDGLREGESEFDDSIIIDAEDGEDRLSDEEYLRLIGAEG